jgi:hypothetical protein
MRLLVLIITTFCVAHSYANDPIQKKKCNIFIHGFTSNNINYFGDLPRQVLWDSTKEITEAAPEVATKVLEQIDTCNKDDLIVLRPHSYGVAIVHYILGQGRRFQDFSPYHDFVQIYKKTIHVYAYTGAYHGTALMDLVCSNTASKYVLDKFGKSCIKSLTTSPLNDVSSLVSNPGVPTYLIHSTNRSGYLGYLGSTGKIIARSMVGFFDFYLNGTRNQNDNTLPIYATRACSKAQLMKNEDQNCRKLDSNYFIDFKHEKEMHHTEFLTNKDFMLMEFSKNE